MPSGSCMSRQPPKVFGKWCFGIEPIIVPSREDTVSCEYISVSFLWSGRFGGGEASEPCRMIRRLRRCAKQSGRAGIEFDRFCLTDHHRSAARDDVASESATGFEGEQHAGL